MLCNTLYVINPSASTFIQNVFETDYPVSYVDDAMILVDFYLLNRNIMFCHFPVELFPLTLMNKVANILFQIAF